MNMLVSCRVLLCSLAVVSTAAFAQLRLSAQPNQAAPAPSLTPVVVRADPRSVDRVVAVVNSEAITERELERKTQSIMKRLRSQGIELPPPAEMQRQVLDRMVTDLAVQQAAIQSGIRIDDATVDRAIARIAQDANASVAQFRQQMEADGLPFASVREEISNELLISRLRERQIDSRVQVSEAEIDAYLEEQRNAPAEYNIAQLLVRVPDNATPAEVERFRQRAEAVLADARAGRDFARIASRYEQSGEPLSGGVLGMRPADRLPEPFVAAVADLPAGGVPPVIRSAAGFHVIKLIERRGGGSGQSAPVQQTRARHILMRVNELNSETEVMRRLEEIRERLQAGTVSFADMARQYSVDGSASQGGDLGWVYAGDTVPDFERAMNALEPGQTSAPVRSPFGYHLIQVQERRMDEVSPERLRGAARSALRTRKSAEAYQEWVAQARDRAYVEYRLEDQ